MLGKVVLITGASSGIGAGTAVHFAAKGCLLALTGRKLSGLQNTLKDCLQAGAKKDDVLLIQADLQVFDKLATIVQKTLNKFGRIDVLINNAGVCVLGDVLNCTSEQYDTTMNTNLKSVFFLTQAALPHLIESKGSIVNVSSVWSLVPAQVSIAYNMSKAALDHFTRTLALDLATKGVRVNAVNPGAVKTPVFDSLGPSFDVDAHCEKIHAMKRAGTLSEVAKSIAFLADNDQSSFTTGVTLLVDGGANLL